MPKPEMPVSVKQTLYSIKISKENTLAEIRRLEDAYLLLEKREQEYKDTYNYKEEDLY